jgi:multiple sugar transport system permease protein
MTETLSTPAAPSPDTSRRASSRVRSTSRGRRPGGAAGPSLRERRLSRTGLLAVTPALLLTAVFFVVPVVLMAWMSLHKWPLLGRSTFIGLDNYVRAFTADDTFLRSIGFTLIYTVVITPILFVAGLALAFFVRRPSRASTFFRTIFFTPYVIGFAAASFLWLWFTDPSAGSVNAILTSLGTEVDQTSWFVEQWPALINVIVMVTWKVVGFQMILLLGGLNSVPEDVLEAAQIDGAGWWRRLTGIILPLMKPTIILVLVFSISGSLLAFEQFFLITKGRPDNETVTAVYWIYNVSFTKFELGYGAALSVIMLVLLLIVAAAQIRLLRGPKND